MKKKLSEYIHWGALRIMDTSMEVYKGNRNTTTSVKMSFYLASIGTHAKYRQQWELMYCITFMFFNIFFSPFSKCSSGDYCTCCL